MLTYKYQSIDTCKKYKFLAMFMITRVEHARASFSPTLHTSSSIYLIVICTRMGKEKHIPLKLQESAELSLKNLSIVILVFV